MLQDSLTIIGSPPDIMVTGELLGVVITILKGKLHPKSRIKFKSRFRQFSFVNPIFILKCTQSVSLVVYYMIFIEKSCIPLWSIPLLTLPRLYRNLGVIPG